jgi:hypothetical protein
VTRPRGSRDRTAGQRRAALVAVALLAAIVAADAASSQVTLVSLLVVVPLVAALGCTPPAVSAFGALALAATAVMGAADDLLGS